MAYLSLLFIERPGPRRLSDGVLVS